jgi:type II secretory pathway component GspD/PulD (secretin)
MKKTKALVLLFGLTLSSGVCFAQEPGTPAAGNVQTQAAEVVPIIVIDEAPLIEAVKTLARQANINFILDPRLTNPEPGPDGQVPVPPNVTIRFENVTAEDALLAVLETYGLQLLRDPKTKVARITIMDPAALPPLVTKVIQLNYANPTNIAQTLIPTIEPRSRVLADGRTRKLIIVATEKDQEAAMELIDQLDNETQQVLIEGNIIETAKNPKTFQGIDWAGTLEAQNFTFGNNPSKSPLAPGLPGVVYDTAAGLTPAIGYLKADGVKAVLSFLNTQEDTEVVSTPRTVTLDNQQALLSVTKAFPIFKITPGSANSPAGAEITYTNLGTILTVTPRIAADNNVSLTVIPEVSNISGQDKQIINGVENIANVYAIRRMETSVLIPSGNTLVMGGLILDDVRDKITKVPILGDIPGLGWFFRSTEKNYSKANLMIFITPTILAKNDFNPASSAGPFLQTPTPDAPSMKMSPMETALPHDWRKPVY